MLRSGENQNNHFPCRADAPAGVAEVPDPNGHQDPGAPAQLPGGEQVRFHDTYPSNPWAVFKPIFKNCSERGVKLNFLIFFHRCIRNKKVCKVKNFQVWVASRYFE